MPSVFRRHCLSAAWLSLLMVGCATTRPGLPPAKVTGLPWSADPADRLCLAARRAVERGEPERALLQLETVLSSAPDHVDAHRLRQDVLRTRGRRGLVLAEARRRVRERPTDGVAHYLLARVTDDPAAKLRAFERAAELAPRLLWPWLGLAHTLRRTDPARARAIYERLYAASGRHPLVGVAYAVALREAKRFEAAARIYERMRDDPRVPGVGELGLAQVALLRERRAEAWGALLQALRQRPFDGGVHALVDGWLESNATADQAAQLLDVLRERGERLRAFATGGGELLLAELLVRSGQPLAARHVLQRRLAEGAGPAERRAYRRLLLRLGDVDAFLAELAAQVPMAVVDDERNQLRARWLGLLRGPWSAGAAFAERERAEGLLRALSSVGLLVEVELCAEIARAHWPQHDETWTALQDEARRELAFEAGLRRLLYHGYRQRDTAALEVVVGRLRELSQRVLGRDCVGEVHTFHVPLVGTMLDPFRGGLAEHLARYNRHLVLGQRAGGTVEGLLVTRLSFAELGEHARLPLPGRSFEVVGFDRDVRALGGVLGADLAGVALLNHYLIDHDAVVEWANGLRQRRRIARRDGLALMHDEIPGGVGLDPLDVGWRLTLTSPVPDEELDAAVLAMIRDHERRHLVDSFHYLPIETNLLSGLGLLLRSGLSPAVVEAEMERRAELAALAVSPHTELVLAHIVDFYGDPPLDSPHHRGFTRLLEQLHDELLALGVDHDRALPSRWHLVPPEVVRTAAGRLLGQLP